METENLSEKIVTSICGCKSCVNKKEELIYTEYKGKIIYFCEEECKTEFLQNPEKFLKSDHTVVKFDLLEEIPILANSHQLE